MKAPASAPARAGTLSIYAVLVITVLAITGYKGSKVLLSLFALQLGAEPFAIGTLMAFYGIGPLLLAVAAGKLIDQIGYFWPLLGGSGCFAIALLLPGVLPRMGALYISAALIGVAFVFFAVSVQGLVGAIGTPETRTRDFATFSLGPAIGAFLGPLAVGFAVDHVGAAHGYLLLGTVPLAGVVMIAALRQKFPKSRGRRKPEDGGAFDLWRRPKLRDMFLVSGIVITALELFTFYMPIYGHSIGMSASAIGVVIAAYAAAAVGIRLFLPAMTRRFGEDRVLTWSMFAAGATFLMFPLFQDARILTAISLLLGVGLGCGQPLGNILAYNRSPAGRVSEVIGMRLTVNKLAEVACPLLFGTLGTAFGVTMVFAANALLLAGGGALNRRSEPR